MYDRGKAACPTLGLKEFVRDFFFTPSMMLNTFSRSKATDSSCNVDDFTFKLGELGGLTPGFQLPNTCSLDKLEAGEGCLMRIPLSDKLDSFLNVALDTCDTKMVRPFVSITCSGPLCKHLAKPCNSDSDCGSELKCGILDKSLEGSLSEADSTIRDLMDSLNAFDNNRDRKKCLQAGMTSSDDGVDLIGSFLSFLRGFYDEKAWDSDDGNARLKLCGSDLLSPSEVQERFLDPVNCHAENENGDVISCEGLQPWDGVLSDGTAVLAMESKFRRKFHDPSGKCSSGAGIRAMFDLQCWGKVGLHLSDRMSSFLSVPNLPALFEWYASTMKKLQDCRGDGTPYTIPYYLANFIPWMPDMFLQRLTASGGSQNAINEEKAGVSKPLGDELDSVNENVKGILEMPKTCDFPTWIGSGTCVMEYAGFSTLIGSPWLFRLRMEVCPKNKYMPKLQIDCEGPACTMIAPAKRCTTDSACDDLGPGNFQCVDIIDEFGISADTDPIGGMLWPRIKDTCSRGVTSTCKDLHEVNLFDCDSEHCDHTSFRRELGHFFTEYHDGKETVSENEQLKFCVPHVTKIAEDLSNGWAASQYSVVADTYAIALLRDTDFAKIGFCGLSSSDDGQDGRCVIPESFTDSDIHGSFAGDCVPSTTIQPGEECAMNCDPGYVFTGTQPTCSDAGFTFDVNCISINDSMPSPPSPPPPPSLIQDDDDHVPVAHGLIFLLTITALNFLL